ncbi:BRO-N domain-containing protein [Streptomyces spongiae]|uniref:Bro-N domain-containing protein n=1 Tax=Streptomyces spongiae TaxID=565072 RepID=A0A5N8XQA8_9ACTN|nr:Bro-N domain-containing protein [Streptomyces spongiae]MPY61670.1 Bro-N domain-containing protein [Streptomyces spongiae]
MNEQNNNTPPEQPVAQRQDAIEISDFVYGATGARVRRLTMPDGTHWFPAVDVCRNLGYAHVGSALRNVADAINFASAESVLQRHRLGIPAGREWRRDMNLVSLQGLIRLVNACTKPASQPFKAWVSEVIATIQRDGSYSLEPASVQPAPTCGTAYVMPPQIADAIVRLEERSIRMGEQLADHEKELREINHSQSVIAEALRDIAVALRGPNDGSRPVTAPELTPQQLLANWKARNLVVTEDVHMVAAQLAPALLHGGAGYSVEEIAVSTGLSHDRVRACLEMLSEQGCVRQVGRAQDGAPFYVLP